MTRWSAGPPIEVRFAVRDGIGQDQRRVPGRDEELVEVGRRPRCPPGPWRSAGNGRCRCSRCRWDRSGRLDPLDPLGPLAPGLEPGEDRPAQVGLGAEVGGDLPGGQAVEPDHLAGGGDDLRARRVAASGRGDEDVSVAAAGVAGQHGERWRRGAGDRDGADGPTGPREQPETHATARAQAATVTRTVVSRGQDGRLRMARGLRLTRRRNVIMSLRRR